MYSIELPSGKTLDLPPGLQFSFQLENAVFAGSSTAALPGSYSFPVRLPATGPNLAAFNLPQLPTAANPVRTVPGAWVRAHGLRMFFGELKLKRAGGEIEVTLVANPLRDTRDIRLPELPLGGERPYGTSTAARNALMVATANDPDGHDFVFCPVSAPFFFAEPPDGVAGQETSWQNRYDLGTGFALAGGPVTPFPKVRYVLGQLVNQVAGWHFDNAWQVPAELARLCFYSNADLHDVDGTDRVLPDTFDLAGHVPDLTGGELFKQLAELFCLGVFTNPFSRTITLRSLDRVLQAAPAHDWTDHVDGSPSIEYEDSDPFLLFRHQAVDYNNRRLLRREYRGQVEDLGHFATEADLDAAIAGGLSPGFHYVNATEIVYHVDQYGNKTFSRHGRERIRFADRPVLEPKLRPLLTGEVSVAAGTDYYVPQYRSQGSYYQTGPTADDTEYLENVPEPSLFFYRGMQGNHPHATVGTLSPDGTGTASITTNGASLGSAAHSLLWPGGKGLYKKQWERWHTILRNGKPVTYRLLLPVTELVRFSFDQKIRILNMDYFVKSLRVKKLTAGRRFVVEAKLYSVI